MTKKDKIRFLAKFKQGSPDECWEWNAGKTSSGYGGFNSKGKILSTHRISYELFKGKIPEGLCVLHICDNRSCVNPNHLWLGTYKDNNSDRAKKNRNAPKDGELCGKAKLTEEQAKKIKQSKLKVRKLAEEYQLSIQAIYNLKAGKTWKHLKENNHKEKLISTKETGSSLF